MTILFPQNFSWAILVYGWSSYFALILSYVNILSNVNITELLKVKMATRQPFLNCLLSKANQVIESMIVNDID